MGYTLEPATDADIPALVRLVNSAYRGDSSRVGWTTEADILGGQRTDPDTLREEMNKGKILCLSEEGGLLGCVFLQRFEDDKGPGCYLGMLTVQPTTQARGLGRLILEGAEDYARRWGATRMTLGVIQVREELIAWYERRGYKPNGETKPFPYGNERFGLPARDDLYFVFFEKAL